MKFSTHVLDKPDREDKTGIRPKSAGPETPGPPRAKRPERLSPRARGGLLEELRRAPLAYGACIVLALIVVTCLAAPLLSPHDLDAIDLGGSNLAPSLTHPFGTDDLGRDMFVRVMHGGRLSLSVAFLATVFALSIGLLAGGAAGYFGGLIDSLIARAVDVVLSIPVFLVILFLSGLISPGIVVLCVLIGLVQWTEVARVVRAVVMSTRTSEFVEAGRALGVSDKSIIIRHILPHTSGAVVVSATLGVAHAVMMESALSFLGFGIRADGESWGAMMQHAQGTLGTAPWLAIFPGLMIFVTVACCFVLGDFLRRALGPERVGLQ